MATTGIKLQGTIKSIRVICSGCTRRNPSKCISKRKFVEITNPSARLNCNYCGKPARFVSLPENCWRKLL